MPRGTSSILDDFNRPNGGAGANWASLNAAWGNPQINGNRITGEAGNTDLMQCTIGRWVGAGGPPADGFVDLVGTTGFANWGAQIGVGKRVSADTGSGIDGYFARVLDNSTGSTRLVSLIKVSNGTIDTLHSATIAWADADDIGIETEGSSPDPVTVRACKNGVPLGGSFTKVDSTSPFYTGAVALILGSNALLFGDAVRVGAMVPDIPPTLTSPTGTGGTLVCSGTVTTDEGNGTLYAVATGSATAPTALQVEAGQDHTGAAALRVVSQAVTSTGAQTVPSGAVSAGTRYLHYMHSDAAGNRSAVVSSAAFTVSAGGDTTPPTLTSPTGAGGTLVCSGTVTTDEGNGTLYAVATSSATAPTAVQVEAGQDHTGAAALRVVNQPVSATGVQTVPSGAVSAGTRYLHYMHRDAAGNRSAVVSSAAFTVGAAPTYGFSTSQIWNNTLLAPRANQACAYTLWYGGAQPGAYAGKTPLDTPSALLNSQGRLVVTGLAQAGPARLEVRFADGGEYWENVTAA
jgi:hypothetical protein